MRAYRLFPLLAALTACATKEPDYVDPPGFAPQETLDVAVAPGVFVLDEGGRIVSATVADRILQRRFAGLADDDASTDRGDQLRLEIGLGATYAEGTRAAVSWRPRAWATFRPLGGSAEAKARPRGDGAVVTYEGAYPGVVAAFGGSSRQMKEYLRVEQPGTAPELRYAVDRGPEFGSLALDDGELWAFDTDGEALFAVMPPLVKDAQGTVVHGTWEVLDEGGQTLVRAALSYEGLVYPLMIDPSFDTPLWVADNRTGGNAQPPARGAAAITYSRRRNEVVMFGGVSGASYLRDTRVRFASNSTSAWDSADLSAATATKPSARAYAAMAAIDSNANAPEQAPVFLFGGQGDNGKPNDELWRLRLSDTAATWSQVTPPSPKTEATWPKARLLHGMAALDDTTLLMFGGVDTAGNLLTDTWSWNGTSWTRLCTDCFPGAYGFTTVPGRSRQTTRDMPVVFGGYSGSTFLSTPRRWNNTTKTWGAPAIADALVPTNDDGIVTSTVIPGSVSPSGRMLGYGFWSNTGKILVGGGLQVSSTNGDTYLNDLWSWESPAADAGRWSRQGSNATLGLPGRRESPTAVYFELTDSGVGDLSPFGLVFGGITSVTSAGSATVTQSTRLYRAYADTVSLSVTRSGTQFTLAATTNIPDRQGYFVRRNGSVWELIPGCTQIINTTGNVTCSTSASDNATTTAFAVLMRDSTVYAQYTGGGEGDYCVNSATSTDQTLCGLNSAFPGQAVCTRVGQSNTFTCSN